MTKRTFGSIFAVSQPSTRPLQKAPKSAMGNFATKVVYANSPFSVILSYYEEVLNTTLKPTATTSYDISDKEITYTISNGQEMLSTGVGIKERENVCTILVDSDVITQPGTYYMYVDLLDENSVKLSSHKIILRAI